MALRFTPMFLGIPYELVRARVASVEILIVDGILIWAGFTFDGRRIPERLFRRT